LTSARRGNARARNWSTPPIDPTKRNPRPLARTRLPLNREEAGPLAPAVGLLLHNAGTVCRVPRWHTRCDQTSLLVNDWQSGRRAAMDELMPVIYDDLRRLARAFLRRERPGHTLQPTALVNEVYLRLVGHRTVSWASRAQFFGLAATMMRRILVNHAEARRAAKRGGRLEQMTIDPLHAMSEPAGLDVMAFECLRGRARLQAVNP
jgi:hypothetical protein